MRLSFTLSLYIARQFIIGVGLILAIVMAIVFLLDTIELLRRAADRETATFNIVIQLALLKLPEMIQKVFPFAILIGGILTLSRLTRSHELIVARSSGVSAWQFLTPVLTSAFLIGVFMITVFNPLSSVMLSRYEQLEAKYLKGRASMLAVSSSGLWLRQIDEINDRRNETIVHALRASQKDMQLFDVIIFMFGDNDIFKQRIDAKTALLEDGYWNLSDVLVTSPIAPAKNLPSARLKTNLTVNQIQNSFSSPETFSFWALPGFIETLEEAGFSALRHKLHWHSVLSLPLFLCSMVLISATFALRPPRLGKAGALVSFGVLTGFLIYFLSDIVHAVGLSGTLPVALAAWSPALISGLAGIAMLLHFEDG